MTLPSIGSANANARSDTTKVQREKWLKAFRQYLANNSDTREVLIRWQKSGCYLRTIAAAIHGYVIDRSHELRARRKERTRKAKKVLMAAILSFRNLESLYRVYGMVEAANRIADEARLAKETLSRIESAFKAKRLGVGRSWADLATIEGFVVEATRQPPTPRELVSLIKAGRAAAGQKTDPWETNPVNIRKGLKLFKKNNQHQSSLWTHPSRPL